MQAETRLNGEEEPLYKVPWSVWQEHADQTVGAWLPECDADGLDRAGRLPSETFASRNCSPRPTKTSGGWPRLTTARAMRPGDLAWGLLHGAGTGAMAWRAGWLAALFFLIVASSLSLLVWEIRRVGGISALVKDEVIPMADAVDKALTRWVASRAERRRLRLREKRRLHKLEQQSRGS